MAGDALSTGAVASSISGRCRRIKAAPSPSLVVGTGDVLWNVENGGPGAPFTSASVRRSITVVMP